MPGWDLAASVYATDVQPDFDGDWMDEANATVAAVARKPALAFEKQPADMRSLISMLPDEVSRGGPTFAGGDPVAPPVALPKGDPARGLPPGVRVPLWTPADAAAPPTRPDAVIPWRKLCTFAVVVVLAFGGYKSYPRAHAWWLARGVPNDLRAYVEGKGVQYSPARQGYSVRLPQTPVHRDSAAPATGATLWLTMRRSIVTGGGYQIVIRVAELRNGAAPLPFGLPSVLVDPTIGGLTRPSNVHLVGFEGKPSYEYDLGSSPPMRGWIFRRGSRVYVVTVQSKRADRVLDTLRASLTTAGG